MIALLQCLLHILGAAYMATRIMSISLAAMLHRRQTIMFVQWVSSNRWVPHPEAKHSGPNKDTIRLVAETAPATGTSSDEANSRDTIKEAPRPRHRWAHRAPRATLPLPLRERRF